MQRAGLSVAALPNLGLKRRRFGESDAALKGSREAEAEGGWRAIVTQDARIASRSGRLLF
jgi:hypothetical protein